MKGGSSALEASSKGATTPIGAVAMEAEVAIAVHMKVNVNVNVKRM